MADAQLSLISTPLRSGSLSDLLHRSFGFVEFRANQEAVCQAAVNGNDVLLVMPTGSGKSLCYQLPGVARGGTTLVISPLIALMEDQVGKLKELGFAVERIHSGRERMASRQACIDYLNGKLQFLFIAPERLRVPGFPEMLAKRKPSLIAVDEAHCISQWGHDFRPDYRMLGKHLPALRPAPVIALTATATTQVQDDISEQLGLHKSARFIHGFRRSNIAIEAVEIAPGRRAEQACALLRAEGRTPAIIYTPTRKQAEALAIECSAHRKTAAYHAGLDADHRKRVQEEFLAGKIDVMVATIAFGMGIDKPDVRTVIHTALPGSLEAYYQEIGRAGRDGKPSRAILMHSYADRHTHDFFFERDYPDVKILDAIFAKLGAASREKAELQKRVKSEADVFDKALEKLWSHGGAQIDFSENVSVGQTGWRESYLAHGEQKRAQIDRVIRYAEGSQCRMSALVRHFGDLADGETACGICDFCAPTDCVTQKFRALSKEENAIVLRAVESLRKSGAKSTGKLYAEVCAGEIITRDTFEEILGALARANLAHITEEVFEKDSKQISYRKVSVPRESDASGLEGLRIKELLAEASAKSKGKAKSASHKTKSAKTSPPAKANEQDARIEQGLREWRLVEARRRKLPAFRIFSDQVIRNLASNRPSNAQELLAISGIGMATVEKYGAQIYKLVRGS